MGEAKDTPGGAVTPEKPPKIKANDNPWYLLATLYGEEVRVTDDNSWDYNHELWKKNRQMWNRYFLSALDEIARQQLVNDKRLLEGDDEPLSLHDELELSKLFNIRCKSVSNNFKIPSIFDKIDFENVQFDTDISFQGYIFNKLSLSGSIFMGSSVFYDSTFIGIVTFADSIFAGPARFRKAKFCNKVHFERARFNSYAEFDRSIFEDITYFNGACFTGFANFSNVTFRGTSDFSNAEMKGQADFSGSIIGAPPLFFDTKLPEGTNFRDITWPKPPGRGAVVPPFVDAYACLKREMDRLKKHEAELDFYAHELQAKQVNLSPVESVPIAIFGVVADFGRSYWRPLLWISVVALAGGILLLPYFILSPNFTLGSSIGQSFGLSLANTLNVFGFRKEFFKSEFLADLPAWIKFLSSTQTIFGTVLLFLFGLGIRNRFRMK